ncbi:MAG: PKD domain-containing protein [Solirubrobacteraceae bacterium]
MALRRALLKVAVLAATLLMLLPAAGLAAEWLPGESREASSALTTPPRVAADAGGDAVAVWAGAGGEINAAFRPRGGPWGAPQNLETQLAITSGVAPRVVAMPNGEFVAAWLADNGASADDLRTATRSTSGAWSAPATVTTIGCCPDISALVAGGDGSVTVVGTDEGTPTSYTRPDGGNWGGGENVPTGSGSVFAAAPDGSLVAVNTGICAGEANCIDAAYRPPGGPWNPVTETAALTPSVQVTGLAVAAAPDSSFTAVWGEGAQGGGFPVAPGAVRSSDRSPGSGGSWVEAPAPIADLPADVPGCPSGFFGCLDVAIGTDGTQVAAWQQHGAGEDRISAAVRATGEDWGPVERAGAAGTGDADVTAGVTSGGIHLVAWPASNPVGGGTLTNTVAHGAHRLADGNWDDQELGSPTAGAVRLDDLSADGDGNALTAWTDATGAFTAGFDGAGPRFTAFSLPSGPAGQALGFSAAAEDNWSAVTGIAWLFGDGAGAPDATTSHAYGAPGGYTATATATDAVGNATEQSGPVTVGAPTPNPTPAPTPTPDVCGTTDKDKDGIKDGCDANDGSARPVAFKTINATVVSGDVFVKLPAGAARAAAAKTPKGFVRLTGAETIPVGSTLDTAHGRVKIRSASDTRRHVQTGQFFRGRFLIRQVRKPRGKAKKRSTKLITELRLTGSSFSRACRSTTASVSAKRRSRKRVRRLFGDGKGSFRTRGRNAAATVRGTRWSVQDRCDGTLVTVQRGRVEVRDLVRHRTVFVRTGHTYLARRR